jgi:hypothetical protein
MRSTIPTNSIIQNNIYNLEVLKTAEKMYGKSTLNQQLYELQWLTLLIHYIHIYDILTKKFRNQFMM